MGGFIGVGVGLWWVAEIGLVVVVVVPWWLWVEERNQEEEDKSDEEEERHEFGGLKNYWRWWYNQRS